VSTRVDARIELSEAALTGRQKYLKLPTKQAPGIIAPMGTWLERTAKADDDAWQKRKIVYMGHLVERQGVATLIRALAILNQKKLKFSAEIIGSGPMEDELKQLAKGLGVANIKFHGFVKDYRDVEKILGAATIAVAPYVKSTQNFTQFADPGKLKAYLGAGLPIVLTDVPPNARQLQNSGAGLIVDDSPQAVADGLEELLNKPAWVKAHQAALKYAEQFDWNHILGRTLKDLGFE
jgi:glycosyltransferase involved in cell wall biosynthesis